jgi:hypothetical protein
MQSNSPTGRGRAKKNPPVKKPKPLNQKSAAEEKVEKKIEEVRQENKYAPKEKIGTPTLGRSVNYVTTVGLGTLKVDSANGYTDV